MNFLFDILAFSVGYFIDASIKEALKESVTVVKIVKSTIICHQAKCICSNQQSHATRKYHENNYVIYGYSELFKSRSLLEIIIFIVSQLLRDSTPCFVGPLVCSFVQYVCPPIFLVVGHTLLFLDICCLWPHFSRPPAHN